MSKILIKIGSSSIIDEEKLIFRKSLQNIFQQISILSEHHEVCLVCSGSKASFEIIKHKHHVKNIEFPKSEQHSAGQALLTNHLSKLSQKNNKVLSQMLISKADFDKNRKLICNKIKDIMNSKFSILMINENDAMKNPEDCFENNDNLCHLINEEIHFDFVLFLSTVDGVLNEKKKAIKKLNEKSLKKVNFFKKTGVGTGGMEEKIRCCIEISKKSKCFILPALKKNSILKIINNKIVGTHVDFKN